MTLQLAAAFEWIRTPGGRAIVCRPLEPFAAHLFTTRDWDIGSAASESASAAGWAAVAGALDVPANRLLRVHQVHGAGVVVRRAHPAAESGSTRSETAGLPDADIIVTDDPSVALAIQTADCVPLLIADTKTGGVAAAHAGWRGLAAEVPAVAVRALGDAFGAKAADLVAAVGPSISAERYEVGEEVRACFAAVAALRDRMNEWFPRQTRPGHWLFDGRSSAIDQLQSAGMRPDRIHAAKLCTAAHPEVLCSYRRDGRRAGRMAAAIRPRRT